MGERIAVAALWQNGTEVIVEERWEDTPEGLPHTLYAFIGGEMDEGESATEAAVRKVREKSGVDISAHKLGKPTEVAAEGQEGVFFSARIQPVRQEDLPDGLLVWTLEDLITHFKADRLMPLTHKFLEGSLELVQVEEEHGA